MVEITFVRHGQANSGAKDEESYDRLSDLGAQQAVWLGDFMAENERSFDRIVSGTLRRQRDTAAAVAGALGVGFDQDARLNEMDYFGLSTSLEKSHAVVWPTSRADFIAHVPQVLSAWHDGLIDSPAESFAAFETRIRAMIADAEQTGGRVMYVCSAGVIAMAARILMGLEIPSYANMLIHVYHTSQHRFVKAGDTLALQAFNAVPHLDRKDRQDALTYI